MIITHVRQCSPMQMRACWLARNDWTDFGAIDTDDGLSGYAAARRVFTWFRRCCANAGDVEGLWDAMYRHCGLWTQGHCDDGD